jgi:hypothetical protein
LPDRTVSAHAIGKVALDLLAEPQAVDPLGLTKRGVFLGVARNRVIFLSLETFRGPLTVNMRDEVGNLDQIERSKVSCSRESIRFQDVIIDLRSAQVWEAATPDIGHILPGESRERNLIRIITRVMERDALSELAHLLPYLMEKQLPETLQANSYWLQISRLKEIGKEFLGNEIQMLGLAQALGDFLGLGPGLTPSGDDFVMGFLLALNRWGKVLFPGLDPAPLNKALENLAVIKTTALSASLIACAAQGQADERLIRAFDGIFTGKPDPGTCADLLSGWGSSSGLDTLAGFIIGHLIGGKHGEG